MKVLCIIQARMGSTRLPGKVLADLAGEPMLVRVVNRVSRAETVDQVAVAISDTPEDDILERLCLARGWNYHRGHPTDLLDRYYQTMQKFGGDPIVRVTSDCPMIDPQVIDRVVQAFADADLPPHRLAYASNIYPRTYPRGLDTEVVSARALAKAWRERGDADPAYKEHVTPYIARRPWDFPFRSVLNTSNQAHKFIRWTVDTQEDLEVIQGIYRRFGNDRFTWLEALSLVARAPHLMAGNQHVQQRRLA